MKRDIAKPTMIRFYAKLSKAILPNKLSKGCLDSGQTPNERKFEHMQWYGCYRGDATREATKLANLHWTRNIPRV